MTNPFTRAGMQAIEQPEAAYSRLYAELKRRIRDAGLLRKRPGFAIYILIEAVVMLAASVVFLLLVDNIWLQMLNAVFMAFAFVRLGFVMHDAGHRQIFQKARFNDLVGLFYANFLLGSSISSWRERHNEHHAHTNELGVDPTLEIPVWAWIEEQAEEKRGVLQWLMKHQAWTFFPVLALSAFFQMIAAVRDVFFAPKVQDRLLQGIFLILHFVWYFGLLFIALPWWGALLFFIINFTVMGLHLGSVFAPNHKGMPVVDPEHALDFLYVQCLTTRNVKPNPLVNYVFGALNFQIEHHLFPGMPRIAMPRARLITREFCAENNIPYHETGVFESFAEILRYMHEIGRPLRERDRRVRKLKRAMRNVETRTR